MPVKFTLNGKPVVSDRAEGACLLDVLREEFGLTGVKCGCREGECGACSVQLDGLLVNSCMVALGSVQGRSVLTIEGLRETPRFAVLSRAFAELSAVQCGFCTPGMLLASDALLWRCQHPSEAEIREGLSGNLCRCTGYNAIVKAVLAAAEAGEGLW